jgi:formate/nitrite transporter FocA (FNT family)
MSGVSTAFEQTVDQGVQRVSRTFAGLLSTGLVGGIDVSLGIFALFLVLHATNEPLLGALAFGIGFIALTLGNSELFTENFLVPVAAAATGKAQKRSVLRLWGGTLVMNLVGGWVMMALIMVGFPQLRAVAVKVGRHYVDAGIGAQSFATAILGGTIITLMTWMERGTPSVPGKLVAAVCTAFLLAAGELNHAIVASLSMFAALQAGAPFGYADFFVTFAWAVLGNMVGGLGLVTCLRLVQVGGEKLREERDRPGPRDGDGREPQPQQRDDEREAASRQQAYSAQA